MPVADPASLELQAPIFVVSADQNLFNALNTNVANMPKRSVRELMQEESERLCIV